MTVGVAAARPQQSTLRLTWLVATIVLTAGSVLTAVALAPTAGADPVRALTWLLFVSSSVHVAATGWFFTVPEVRRHVRTHRARYVVVPAAVVVATACVAAAMTPRSFAWLLLGFFAWQFFHFQKQNLGLAALACAAERVPGLSVVERRALMLAGLGGIVGLMSHPELLQLSVAPPIRSVFYGGGLACAIGVAMGVRALSERSAADRPAAMVAIYLLSLLFFAPVFAFRSPYAAVAGLTLAHGLQYLLVVGLVAGGQRSRSAALNLAVLLNVAVIGGILLNLASHQHSGGIAARAVYGVYLGLVMAHFVVDAGLWRLRDEFPRSFLRAAMPYLLPR